MKRALLLALLPALLVAGCGTSPTSSGTTTTGDTTSSAGTAPGPSGSPHGNVGVTIKNFAYSPSTVHAKVGQSVKWTNQDQPPHNVVSQGGPKFSASPILAPGDKFTLKLTQPGTIHYICSIHPYMKATIVVER